MYQQHNGKTYDYNLSATMINDLKWHMMQKYFKYSVE